MYVCVYMHACIMIIKILIILIITKTRTLIKYLYFIYCSQIGLNFHKSVSRFAVLHLVATNLCMWAMTVIMESGNTYARHEHEHRTARLDVNDTTSNNDTNNGMSNVVLSAMSGFYRNQLGNPIIHRAI